MKISVLGAGAFGTALAISLAQEGRDVTLWARDPRDMAKTRENGRRLPGFRFPDQLTVTGDMNSAVQADIVLLATPMQALSGFLAEHGKALDGKALVATCKGIDLETGRGPVEIIRQFCPNARPALLSGPSFAVDIAAGLPTALTLASHDGADLQQALSTTHIRLYRSRDLTGVALGGALKNVIAIAAGLAIGSGMGDSARAALMARGFAEMTRFAVAQGALPDTLAGLSGLGDLVLTCTSEKSRNFSYGLALGRGDPLPENTTVEGKSTAKAVSSLAKKADIDMPVANMVVGVLAGRLTIEGAREMLLARPLKEE